MPQPMEHTPYTIAWLTDTGVAIEAEHVGSQDELTAALTRRQRSGGGLPPFLVFEGRCKALKVRLVDNPQSVIE